MIIFISVPRLCKDSLLETYKAKIETDCNTDINQHIMQRKESEKNRCNYQYPPLNPGDEGRSTNSDPGKLSTIPPTTSKGF